MLVNKNKKFTELELSETERWLVVGREYNCSIINISRIRTKNSVNLHIHSAPAQINRKVHVYSLSENYLFVFIIKQKSDR